MSKLSSALDAILGTVEWDRLLTLKYLSAVGGYTIDLSRTRFSMTVWDHCEENTISECSKQVTIKLMRTVIAKYFVKFMWASSCDVLFSTQSLLFRLVIFLHHLRTFQPSQEHLRSSKLVKDSPWTVKERKKTCTRKTPISLHGIDIKFL